MSMIKKSKGKIEDFTTEGVEKRASSVEEEEEVHVHVQPSKVVPNLKDVLEVSPFDSNIDINLNERDDDVVAEEC